MKKKCKHTFGSPTQYNGVLYATCEKCHDTYNVSELKQLIPQQEVLKEFGVDKAQQRKNTPVFSGCLAYFPNALKEVSKASLAGNKQHLDGQPLHWDKSKSTDHADALVRHLLDHAENPVDDDGVLHLSKTAWRALALLEQYLENK